MLYTKVDTMTNRMWMVRAGERAAWIDDFEQKGYVGIGWSRIKNIQNKNLEEIKEMLKEAYIYSKGKLVMTASQIYKFKEEISKGEYVISYNHEDRVYLVGIVEGNYEEKEGIMVCSKLKKVNWKGKINRDDLSTSTKNTLGSISTLFEIRDTAKEEILNLLKGVKEKPIEESVEVEEEQLDELKEDVANKAKEFAKDKILKLDWEQMEELVAGIIRAMGFKTRLTEKGSDRGRDILASPDGLGLKDPRIVIEVKHRRGKMDAKELRNFISSLKDTDRGIYVSTGGFTKEAKYESDRARVPIKMLNADELVELIFEYYDTLDLETKNMIPLVKIYWPVG